MIHNRICVYHKLQFAMWGSILSILVGCGQSDEESPSSPAAASSAAVVNQTSSVGNGTSLTIPSQKADSATKELTAAEPLPASVAVPASPEIASPASESASVAKTKRDPIYVEEANGKELIATALKKAQRDHKHVLIEWGGNWCGWCYKLHDVFLHEETVRPIVHEEFVLVLIDQGENHDLMLEYGGKDRQYSYPHLTILDSSGHVLTNQETGSLEDGPKHDPQRVSGFLTKWMPEKLDAEQLLASAMQQAAAEDKRVLMHVGTPYCGWCNVLAQFLQDHETLFARDYVDLKIDTLRMTNGTELAARYQANEQGGVPWMVILDEAGKVLISSFGPEGNIGYPCQPNEISHFLTMLSSTRRKLTDAELETISTALNSYRETKEAKTN